VQDFQLEIPTKIIFGRDRISELGAEVSAFGRRALLVFGQGSIKRTGLYDTVRKQLADAGVSVTDHAGVKPNPVLSHTEEGIALAKEKDVDVILAVGGGSVIDESKGIAIGAVTPPPVWDFYTRKRAATEALPIVAVQTLPATSSELNAISVITNEETKEKFSTRSVSIFPRVSILDPTLTTSIPIQYTAYACTDILSHMMEGYFTTTAKWLPIQDGMVEGISRGVIAALDRLMEDPKDIEAREVVMWAGAIAWSGLMNAGVEGAAVPNHMLEHPLSADYDVTHGAGLSVVIPAWLRHMKPRIKHRIIQYGRNILGVGDRLEGLDEDKQADIVIEALEAWYRKIGTPVTFDEAGIENPDIDMLSSQAMQLADLWGVPGYTTEDAQRVYTLCGRD